MALPFGYHWRNLLVRRTTTVLTVLVVTAVVGALAWILGFAFALNGSLAVARDTHKLIVIRRGSSSESSSAIPPAEFNTLSQLTGVARDPATGEPLLSPEVLVQVNLPRLRDGGRSAANVAVRGVTDVAFRVHPTVRPLGAVFGTGGREIIVGVQAARQFQGLQVGDTVHLGFGNDRSYTVVGHFDADGGPLESEIWGYLPSLMNAYQRVMYSCAALRVAPDVDPDTVVAQVAGPAIGLDAKSEARYWREQSSRIRAYLAIVATLVLVMALAAVLSIANTMFAAVAGRTREIAMLRTIGFRRHHIVLGFVLEAVLLSVVGGALGCLACLGWLSLVGSTKDMYGTTTFTTLAFDIRLTPAIAGLCLALVAGVGAAGALVPAWRASRVGAVAALREG